MAKVRIVQESACATDGGDGWVKECCGDVIEGIVMLLLQATTSPGQHRRAVALAACPHRTFSPSVSCTALGSAPRFALPLAWAICRYMDV